MSRIVHNFILFTLLTIFWHIGAANSKPSIVESNGKSNDFEEETRWSQHFNLFNARLHLLEERIDFMSEKLNFIFDRLDARSYNTEQSSYSDFQKLQINELQVIKKQTGKIGDVVFENRELLNDIKRYLDSKENTSTSPLIKEPSNCIEASRSTRKTGIYEIFVPKFNVKPFEVYCNDDIDSGGWTVILRRINGSVDFNRNWYDYREGFGDLRGEFFIGLEKLHALTTSERKQELYFFMESSKGQKKYAKYDAFVIGNEHEEYSINELGKFRGNVTDEFREHQYQSFRTKNFRPGYTSCAQLVNGGWWFSPTGCLHAVFTGPYDPTHTGVFDTAWQFSDGIDEWTTLAHAMMMIRPANAKYN